MKRIYLDYNATTPVQPLVAKEMEKYIYEHFGNPSSSHWYGKKAREGVEKARQRVAGILGCLPEEVIFTGGGTESNNYAIRGVAETYKDQGNHIITSGIEHPAVLKPCQYLEKRGFEVTYLPVDRCGMVNPDGVRNAIKPGKTILVTIMHANNETGAIQRIEEISKIIKAFNSKLSTLNSQQLLFHTDAAQSLGKIPVKVNKLGVDFLTVAGHKLYAPKGVGALYIRKGIRLQSFILGAGHENGRRAGTENVIEIAGLGKACELVDKQLNTNSKRIRKLRDKLYQGMLKNGIGIKLNGPLQERLPNTLNISFKGIESGKLLKKIPEIAVSAGSACHANSKVPSAVLTAMGVSAEDAFSALRISLGIFTTEEEINYTIEKLIRACRT